MIGPDRRLAEVAQTFLRVSPSPVHMGQDHRIWCGVVVDGCVGEAEWICLTLPTSAEPMPNFQTWNERLLQHFFPRRSRLRSVRLNIDVDELAALGGDVADIVAAVKEEAREHSCETIQDLAVLLHTEWMRTMTVAERDDTGYEPPPYLPILVVYVLAVNHGASRFPAHAYYDRLHDLLETPSERIDSIRRSIPLWLGLQDWSTKRAGGRRGVFEVGVVGQQLYVGIPRRQVLLAPREVPHLRRAFSAADLLPGSTPSDRRLHDVVRGADGLLSRTTHLLSKWPSDPASVELLDEIRRELDDWDHVAAEDLAVPEAPRLPLRLRLRHRAGRIEECELQVDPIPGLTDEDRHLVDRSNLDEEKHGALWLRAGEGIGPATVVSDEDDSQIATRLPWFDPLELGIDGTGANLFRDSSKYLVLKPGDEFNTLEETSIHNLEAGALYVLLVRSGDECAQPSFVAEFKTPWRQCDLGAPVAHCGFMAQGVGDDVRRGQARLNLHGGIRSSAGSRSFFPFALPEVVADLPASATSYTLCARAFDLRGRSLGDMVLASGSPPLLLDADRMLGGPRGITRSTDFSLPDRMERAGMCELELEVDGAIAATSRLFIDHSPESPDDVRMVARDGFGKIVPDASSGRLSGLEVHELDDQTAGLASSLDLPLAGRPLGAVPELPPDVAGRRLMELLRFRRRISWPMAKKWLPQCLPRSAVVSEGARYVAHQVSVLHALGVAELVEDPSGGLEALLMIPPQLVLLPRRVHFGLDPKRGVQKAYEVMLTGCWLNDEIEALTKRARRIGAMIRETGRSAGAALAPHRRTFLMHEPDTMLRLRSAALELGIGFEDRVPLSVKMAQSLSSVSALLESEAWIPGRPPGVWDTRYFDPRTLGVGDEAPGDRFVMWECRNANRPVWQHFIVDNENNRRLPIDDRQLGRWFVRIQALPGTPVPVSADDFFVPLELRLPRALERALTLSSGEAPELRRYVGGSPFSDRAEGRHFQIPPPPDQPVDWLAFRPYCTGNFCRYPGAYDTAAWRRDAPLPMLDVNPESTQGFRRGD